jgi:hypothetical protein
MKPVTQATISAVMSALSRRRTAEQRKGGPGAPQVAGPLLVRKVHPVLCGEAWARVRGGVGRDSSAALAEVLIGPLGTPEPLAVQSNSSQSLRKLLVLVRRS